mmetsp:Transcript_28062/g.90747  ORF Transcript_28062/g.90747 Transcript_28062/m.90747 type:complete len:108 (-) Transcript_28062:485-808(-)|eukprot:scaffold24017_cov118-Isochrysis_galbana.AAC.7
MLPVQLLMLCRGCAPVARASELEASPSASGAPADERAPSPGGLLIPQCSPPATAWLPAARSATMTHPTPSGAPDPATDPTTAVTPPLAAGLLGSWSGQASWPGISPS